MFYLRMKELKKIKIIADKVLEEAEQTARKKGISCSEALYNIRKKHINY